MSSVARQCGLMHLCNGKRTATSSVLSIRMVSNISGMHTVKISMASLGSCAQGTKHGADDEGLAILVVCCCPADQFLLAQCVYVKE